MLKATKDPYELKRRRDILISQVPKPKPLTLDDIFKPVKKVDRSNEPVIWRTHPVTRDEELRYKLTN